MKPGDKIFVYPNNCIIGEKGTIGEHIIGRIEENKVIYKDVDKDGYIGARLGVCFATREEAEAAKQYAITYDEVLR